MDTLLAGAERQGLLVVEEDLRVRFSHPLIGSAVYGRMRPLARRALHARLAAGASDTDVRARHLALSTDEPSAAVAKLLEEAAVRARGRGAFDLAAEFAGHSLRLTPSIVAEAALRRAFGEIEDLALAGEMSRALALADRLVASLPRGPRRADALIERAYLEDDQRETSEALLRQALDDAGADLRLRGHVLDQLGWVLGMFRGNLAEGIECVREAVALAEQIGDARLEMSCTAVLAYLAGLSGAAEPDLMTRALALEAEIGKPILWASPPTLLAEHLLWAGDLPAARARSSRCAWTPSARAWRSTSRTASSTFRSSSARPATWAPQRHMFAMGSRPRATRRTRGANGCCSTHSHSSRPGTAAAARPEPQPNSASRRRGRRPSDLGSCAPAGCLACSPLGGRQRPGGATARGGRRIARRDGLRPSGGVPGAAGCDRSPRMLR